MASQSVGMFLIGIAVGLYMRGLPVPLDFLNPYFGIALLIVAVILFVKGD